MPPQTRQGDLPQPHLILFHQIKYVRQAVGEFYLPPPVGAAPGTCWPSVIWVLQDGLSHDSTSSNPRKFFLLSDICLPFTFSQQSQICPPELHYFSLIPFPLGDTWNIFLRLWSHLPESALLQAKCPYSPQLLLMWHGDWATQCFGCIVLDALHLSVSFSIWNKADWESQPEGQCELGEGRCHATCCWPWGKHCTFLSRCFLGFVSGLLVGLSWYDVR